MKFLVDNALSPVIAVALAEAGHDALHLRDLGIASAPDEQVFEAAAEQGRVLVSADTDFGAILAQRQTKHPSVLLLRRQRSRRPAAQVEQILRHLDRVVTPLTDGAVVILEPTRIRIRRLPMGPH